MGVPTKPAGRKPELCCLTAQGKGHAYCPRCGAKLLHMRAESLEISYVAGIAICEVSVRGARTTQQVIRCAVMAMADRWRAAPSLIDALAGTRWRVGEWDLFTERQTVKVSIDTAGL